MEMENEHRDDRTTLLLGEDGMAKLKKSHVLVMGIGGVGGYVCEFLARAGVGHLTIVDNDVVKASNINRQIIATEETVDEKKIDVMKERLLSINNEIVINTIDEFYHPSRVEEFFSDKQYDYAVDAIDSLVPKISFIKECFERKIPIVSSMGAGGRIAPEHIKIADISETHHCRLASNVRYELKKIGITKGLTTIFSDEQMSSHCVRRDENLNNKVIAMGTISYLPAMFAGFAVSVVLRGLLENKNC